jgi:hypothetical protein
MSRQTSGEWKEISAARSSGCTINGDLDIVWSDMVASRFRDHLIAEDRVITDLAERLLLVRKR